MQEPRGSGHEGFRPDVEGLRGVAVLLVVLFHSGLVGVPGGFVGVDVFFVISGFLITGLLLRERQRTGRIGLQAFYARRVRRLLPAAIVALTVTLVVTSVVLAPLDRASGALDAAAAALSIGNVRFALAAGDYFASVASPSPFLHFWSLGVEEQFYLVWPAVVLLSARGRRPRLGAGIALAAILVASLAANVVVTDVAVNWAFYSLPTRAWQLALGGLLALGATALGKVPGAVSAVLGWAGMGALVWASLAFDGDLAYPGLAALVPTVAAAAMVQAAMTRGGPGALLATPPLRFLGRISYSLYLWHWPILVLPAAALEAEPEATVRLALVGLAFVVAWASWRFVEEPFRAGFPVLARRPGRTILAGATAIALVVASAGGFAVTGSGEAYGASTASLDTTTPDRQPDGPIPLDTEEPYSVASPPAATPGATTSPTAGSSPAASPATPTSPSPSAPAAETTPPAGPVPLPRDVRPRLGDAREDEERLRADGCLAFERVTTPPACIYGDRSAAFTVALVGDSHAAQWFPALARVASQRHWRVLTFVKVACPFVDMRVRNIALKREYTECASFREATVRRLSDERPDLVLVSLSRFAIHPVLTRDASVDAQATALARMLDRVIGRVAVIVDTPEAGRDVPSCLSRHADDVRRCAIARSTALSGQLGAIETAAAAATGSGLIDLTGRVCRAWPCQVVVDGMITFRDTRHLTATFAKSLAPDLDRAIATAMESARDGPRQPG